MARAIPTGTVTFLFSDVEGSTKHLEELGAARYAELLMAHRAAMREAFAANGGVELGTEGDSFFVAFPSAPGAIRAAAAAQTGIAALPLRVRMGIHTGTPEVVDGDYVGMDVHRAARIAAAGHGGQVLLSATTVALAGTEGLRDLGEHRLKDLAAPERIWQLGDAPFPPLRSLHRTNLPIAPTPFVGRERELTDIAALVASDAARVVTLTGPGGTGKTRLAMQAAAESAERYPQGVWWVPLEAVRSPELVSETVAGVLGAKGDLAEHVGDKKMLVILDNFEQVIEAASGVSKLLGACPGLDHIVTSREPLRIRGEREYPVPPLTHDEATRLFVERARELGREVVADADVSEICRRLDELPLAIELAAARVKVLSPAQIASRLERRLPLLTAGARDVSARQRTLRGAIEWSHDLLSPEEQRLFARLAVFRGGWTVEAAEAVADADLDTLQSLVEKSLVRQAGERFAMLETIREYAAERFAASDEADEIRRRHTEHFVALALGQERVLLGSDPGPAVTTLTAEHDNVRAAFEDLEERGDSEQAMRLGWAMHEFWCIRGHATEAWERLRSLLAMDPRPNATRGRAAAAAAHLARRAGASQSEERRLNDEALELLRRFGDEWAIAYVEFQIAGAATDEDFAAGRPLLVNAIEKFERLGERTLALAAMRSLAWATLELGDEAGADRIYQEVYEGARRLGSRRMEGIAIGPLAFRATKAGRYREALGLLREALAIDRAVGDVHEVSLIFTRLAMVHAGLGRPEIAGPLLGRSEALREETGESDPDWVRRLKDGVLADMRAAMAEDAVAAALERGRRMSTEEAEAIGFAPLDDPATPLTL